MKLLLFNYKCAVCNTVTKAPGLSDMAYGEFIMFNSSGDSLYLNSFKDSVFNEFEVMFEEISKNFKEIKKKNATHVFQATFSVTCDSSENGNIYSITSFPSCESCGSRKMASWGPTNPREFTGEMQSPTHERWNKLTELEKKMKAQEAIERILSDK